MVPYHVTSLAKATFLTSKVATVPADTAGISPRIYCSHRCLRLRSGDVSDFSACNGFLYEDGNCHLGYADPNWIHEQKLAPGTDATLYFDVVFP